MARPAWRATTINVGVGCGVALRDRRGTAVRPADGALRAFCGPGRPALTLTVHPGRPSRAQLPTLLFDSSGPWTVYRVGTAFGFALQAAGAAGPYETAIIDFAKRRGRILLAASKAAHAFDFPLSEIVCSRLLAARRGLILHAAGVTCHGQGLALAGYSGAGKSTLATLFARLPGARILSDDRVVLQLRGGRARVGGTPWHGTAGFALPESAQLAAVVLLRHGRRNRLARLRPAAAAARLLALTVMPAWDPRAAAAVVATGIALCSRYPVYEFAFVPGGIAVERLVGLLPLARR